MRSAPRFFWEPTRVLRRERDARRRDSDVQRLDAEPVAGEEQRLRRGVPDGEREHAAQPSYAIGALVLVEMEDGLGVALSGELVSPCNQPTPELAIVVDLAVEDDDLRPIFVENRLSPASQIDDAEPAHPEAHGALQVDALVVWPPMRDRPAHPPNRGGRDRPGRIFVNDADDAAHSYGAVQQEGGRACVVPR